VYVLHENPEWYPPFAAAFDAEGLEHEQWLLGAGTLDLDAEPPEGVFWSRLSASSHARGHQHAKDHARAVLSWLEAWDRRVVNGRRVLELEVSKADQLTALRAAGIEVPRTLAVAGRADLLDAAGKMGSPFIVKHNQGGKGLGVRRFDSVGEFGEYLDSPGYEPPVDGITLVQEYLRAAEPFITRVEIVAGELVYALTADTARGGFELCPADACAVGSPESLFALREGFADPGTASRWPGSSSSRPPTDAW
jgi:glutathione synthase/RimK-type ligase-like ATP-grasp enzyme